MSGVKAPYGEMVPGHEWLIWSNEKAGWMNPALTGCTRILENAGRFDIESAKAYIKARNALPIAHGGHVNAFAVSDPWLAPVLP
jgi:hypothetical protein